MGASELSRPTDNRDGEEANADQMTQATSVAVAAAALVVWWPAFTLGAYGVIFFQQFALMQALERTNAATARCSN